MRRSVPRKRHHAPLCVGAFALAAFLVLAGIAAHQHLVGVDRAAELERSRLLQTPMEGVSWLGSSAGVTFLILVASAALWRCRRGWALSLPLVMAGTGVLQLVAKWAVHRPRPNLQPWGFPSGHVLTLVVFFGLVAYLVWTSTGRRRWRCLAAGAGAVLVAAVAYSRLYLEMHWLTDVVGGFAVGLAYLMLAILIAEAVGERRAPSALGVAASGTSALAVAAAGIVVPPSPQNA